MRVTLTALAIALLLPPALFGAALAAAIWRDILTDRRLARELETMSSAAPEPCPECGAFTDLAPHCSRCGWVA